MNYNEAYNYLLSFSNFPRKEYMGDPRHCAVYIKRLQFFLDLLKNPERKIPHYIHVTGTSGKGSTVAMMHSILRAAGYKTGSTYSPHPSLITERWKINGRHMSKFEFCEIIESIKPKLDEYLQKTPYDMLSFFEITEAIGFLWFAKNNVEWAVLEVACGGRFDSSNVIPYKDVAVITNIGLDHVGIIGNNKKEIAYEKAGIIKKGTKVFTAEQDDNIYKIIKQEADKLNAPIYRVSPKATKIISRDFDGSVFNYGNERYNIPAIGSHQINNALQCIEIAKLLKINIATIKNGLKKIKLPIRMEKISDNPLVILDSAHNLDKIKSSVASLLQIIANANKTINLVLGFSEDKDLRPMIKELLKLKPKYVACTRNTINPFRKVADPKEIGRLVKNHCPQCDCEYFFNPDIAYQKALNTTGNNSVLLVTGSVFLSGELRKNAKKLTI